MNQYDEAEFLYRIPDTEKASGSALRISCPYCLEGNSNGWKKRGYILSGTTKDYTTYYCHNCGVSTSLRHLLEDHYPYIFEDYKVKEKNLYIIKLKAGKVASKRTFSKPKVEREDLPPYITLGKEFMPLAGNNEAISYLRSRKIPEDKLEGVLYTKPDLSYDGVPAPFRDCIIFPFYHGEKIYGFQARSYRDKYFHTVVDEGWKVYNFFNVKKRKPVYIIEGIIDSLFIPNSISCLGSDISSNFLDKLPSPVFVFDNDKTGKSKAVKYCEQGHKIFIWPKDIKVKDINEGIMKGVFTTDGIFDIIKDNIFQGFQAKVRLKI